MTREVRILVAAGGSGGHSYPALAFIDALKKTQPLCHVTLVLGNKDIEKKIVASHQLDSVHHIDALPFRGLRSLMSPRDLSALWRNFANCRRLLKKERPRVVWGFGGYVTVPVILAAASLGLRTMIQEQNRTFGLANRLLSVFALRVATVFPFKQSAKYFQSGMPMRSELRDVPREEALHSLGLDPSRLTMLVIGGSQGARKINETMLEFLAAHEDSLKRRWQVVHLTGHGDYEALKQRYTPLGVPHILFPFYADVSIIYAAADVVISRAGSMTLHELAYFKKCAILVPYEGARGHQIHNARMVSDHGGAYLIREAEFSAAWLRTHLTQIEEKPALSKEMGERAPQALNTDGRRRLVEETFKLMASS